MVDNVGRTAVIGFLSQVARAGRSARPTSWSGARWRIRNGASCRRNAWSRDPKKTFWTQKNHPKPLVTVMFTVMFVVMFIHLPSLKWLLERYSPFSDKTLCSSVQRQVFSPDVLRIVGCHLDFLQDAMERFGKWRQDLCREVTTDITHETRNFAEC